MRMLAGDNISAPWFSTPGYLQDRARAAHAALMNLNDTIDQLRDGSRIAADGGRYKAWKRTIDNFGKWYGATDAMTWLWSGTDATLDAWEATIREWQNWVRMTFPDAGKQLVEAPAKHRAPYSIGEIPMWMKVAGGFAAVGALAYMLRK